MNRDLGIARCGLACCICSHNSSCSGCSSESCDGKDWCENRLCSIEKKLKGCYECSEACSKGLLQKIKPQAFILFIRRYGIDDLITCLERNEKAGVVYHREGNTGDYDYFDDVEKCIEFIKTGQRSTTATKG